MWTVQSLQVSRADRAAWLKPLEVDWERDHEPGNVIAPVDMFQQQRVVIIHMLPIGAGYFSFSRDRKARPSTATF